VLIVVMLIVGIRGAATQPSLTANAVAH